MVDYLELLIKISESSCWDVLHPNYDEAYDRVHGCKQGYLVTSFSVGYKWGINELDPKYFLRLIISANQYDPKWLESEYYQGKEITDKAWVFPLAKILTSGELEALKSIPYNETNGLRPSIVKAIEDISTIVELVDWDNRPEPFELHGSAGTHTIRPAGSAPAGDYTTLQAAHEGEDGTNLVTASEGVQFQIEHNGTDWGDVETTHFDIDNWTVNASYYVSVYAVGAASHNSGVYRATGWRLNQLIDNEVDYTRIYGGQSIYNASSIMLSTTGNGTRFHSNVFNLPDAGVIAVNISVAATVNIYSNVIYKVPSGVGQGIFIGALGITVNIFNNTIAGFADGVKNSSTGTTNIINCALFNNTDDIDDAGNSTLAVDYCATDQGAGEGTNGVNISGTWDSTCFTDAGGTGPDFSVQDALSPLYQTGNGATPKSIFTTDIIGTTMGPADLDWPIGAFELVAAPSGRIMSSLVGPGGLAGMGGIAGQGGGLAG
jgi:hypothetical protein